MLVGVTGSKGFIGSYLSRRLAATRPGSVRLILRNTADDEVPMNGTEVVPGDLRSPADCERFAKDLDLIYYLSHVNIPLNSDLDQPKDALFNLVPLLNLLQAIEHLGTRPHIVYFSSGGAVYGPKHDRVPYRETDLCVPMSSYGIQKLAAEQYLRLAAHKGYLTATVLRAGNAYGTLLPQHRMQGLIGVAINNVLHGRRLRIFGDPNNVRDYVHLEDVCAIVERASLPQQPFSVFNVGSGQGYSVADILGVIQECHGSRLETEVEKGYGDWLPDWVVLDNSKARHELGWRPAIDLRSGIEGMMAVSLAEKTVRAATVQSRPW